MRVTLHRRVRTEVTATGPGLAPGRARGLRGIYGRWLAPFLGRFGRWSCGLEVGKRNFAALSWKCAHRNRLESPVTAHRPAHVGGLGHDLTPLALAAAAPQESYDKLLLSAKHKAAEYKNAMESLDRCDFPVRTTNFPIKTTIFC